MSNGGNFTLLANDGKADRLIHASKLLHQRINDVTCARAKVGYADPTPTLVDLEKTHILFMNAHYKPFAATGMEYNKVGSGGTITLGSSVQFSIPQFGDFFNDMVVRAELDAINSSSLIAPSAAAALGANLGASEYPASATVTGNAVIGWDNQQINDSLGAPLVTVDAGADGINSVEYSIVDSFGNAVTDGANYRNLIRYCDYPGERLFKKVKFEVNGNPLDEYTDIVTVLLRKFTIGSDKITAYKRLVGQEICLEGVSAPMIGTVEDSHNNGASDPADTFNSFYIDGTIVAGDSRQLYANSASPASSTPAAFLDAAFPDAAWNSTVPATKNSSVGYQNVARKCISVKDGLQTPKYQQPSSVLWIPLNFWFNKDVRLSIPSVSIPYGQRFIDIDLATSEEMVSEYTNLYVRQEIVTSDTGAVSTQISYRPFTQAGTVPDLSLKRIELYINNIFVNPEVHDVFIKQIGFSLIRVFRTSRSSHSETDSSSKLLSQLKFPIEFMLVGIAPQFNDNRANANRATHWHIMGKPFDIALNDQNTSLIAMNSYNAGPVATPLDVINNPIARDTYTKIVPVATTVDVSAHAVPLFKEIDQAFFSSYIPFTFGGSNIVAPDDAGAMMINFAHFPGSYQPSGHINASRAREFYIGWKTTYAGANTATVLHVVASAINFLLISDGSAVLRYST
jgi:hypothetical protein